MCWIRLQLRHIAHFTQMPARGVTSWVRLLCTAATQNTNISQLLPIYTSLAQPPADVKEVLEYLVATTQMLLGPPPDTQKALRQHPERYLSWLHLLLTEFQAAQGTPYAPKMFSLLPQTGHHNSFIKISTTSLHKSVTLATSAGRRGLKYESNNNCRNTAANALHHSCSLPATQLVCHVTDGKQAELSRILSNQGFTVAMQAFEGCW